ncbi:hypothetical protein [Pseudomonas typographi]|uniref:Uncharacterized protein n=1 Tax=Pseudomonas typographi TaxID=2715964 RepID=A0ABR7Z203_9PSED|nr:hypothetical protein [Pseudomonas typographi]MBD1599510.1 hypothetical protein [Pseudomonas typographi]
MPAVSASYPVTALYNMYQNASPLQSVWGRLTKAVNSAQVITGPLHNLASVALRTGIIAGCTAAFEGYIRGVLAGVVGDAEGEDANARLASQWLLLVPTALNAVGFLRDVIQKRATGASCAGRLAMMALSASSAGTVLALANPRDFVASTLASALYSMLRDGISKFIPLKSNGADLQPIPTVMAAGSFALTGVAVNELQGWVLSGLGSPAPWVQVALPAAFTAVHASVDDFVLITANGASGPLRISPAFEKLTPNRVLDGTLTNGALRSSALGVIQMAGPLAADAVAQLGVGRMASASLPTGLLMFTVYLPFVAGTLARDERGYGSGVELIAVRSLSEEGRPGSQCAVV